MLEGGGFLRELHCLEVNDSARPTHIPVRDSKTPTGPAILFSASAWTEFVAAPR
ncbi:DUF397 domain-containing protein [Streptomyces sp. HUAS 31]|uniref:DUF397 domain-containing protein n=1 Tax=Streptomyces TaxID=1883 RepID=UPI0023051CDA|nr:DUF397 domain-containing protein [Streptomyces sp. HUAS 31]WCD97411.1 DUF397 domain-containing protein [Streptomyces sp. HUAS 31]